VPGHEELTIVAIARGGLRVLNQDLVRELGIPDDIIDRVAERPEGAALVRSGQVEPTARPLSHGERYESK
jgi:predicted phosphoribosyltransferase